LRALVQLPDLSAKLLKLRTLPRVQGQRAVRGREPATRLRHGHPSVGILRVDRRLRARITPGG
jgi:hypothetical protein